VRIVADAPNETEEQRARDEAPRAFRLDVIDGPAAGAHWVELAPRCQIGSHPRSDLRIADPRVSRFHCEVAIEKDGAHLRDLGSRNGTLLDGVEVRDALLRPGSLIVAGQSTIQFSVGEAAMARPLSTEPRFGVLVGRSIAMREAFALLERAAASKATLLLEGETGTGKSEAAEAVHAASPWRDGPLVIVDCGALAPTLIESELFGHERGAFTGADSRRLGAFEQANGGTLFLDEIGELPLELQPKLLRVLETKRLRRLGGSSDQSVDVRFVAGTHRDLRSDVNEGGFRSDLYFRLAILRVRLPPLRERLDDLPLLARALLDRLSAPADSPLRSPGFAASLARRPWPGNVRELRNFLERTFVYGELGLALVDDHAAPADVAASSARLPFSEARERAILRFEREYLEGLMQEHGGKGGASAAAAAGINRVYLYRLLLRHGLQRPAK